MQLCYGNSFAVRTDDIMRVPPFFETSMHLKKMEETIGQHHPPRGWQSEPGKPIILLSWSKVVKAPFFANLEPGTVY